MKQLSAITILFLLASSAAVAPLTIKSEAAPITAFDSWENICWRFEKVRLDNFAIHLQRQTSFIGYIIVYAGRDSCSGEAVTRAVRAKKWLEKRGVPTNKILWRNGGFREQPKTELWVWPIGEGVFPVDPTLTMNEVKIVNKCRGKILHPAKCN